MVSSLAHASLTVLVVGHDGSSNLEPPTHDDVLRLNPQTVELTLASMPILASKILSVKARRSAVLSLIMVHQQPKRKSIVAAAVGQHTVITGRAGLGTINRPVVDDDIVS